MAIVSPARRQPSSWHARLTLLVAPCVNTLRRWAKTWDVTLPQFTIADHIALATACLGERARQLDLKKIFRFAPNLSACRLRHSFDAFRDAPTIETDRVVEYLREHHMVSNVDLAEVQAASLHDLKGLRCCGSK